MSPFLSRITRPPRQSGLESHTSLLAIGILPCVPVVFGVGVGEHSVRVALDVTITSFSSDEVGVGMTVIVDIIMLVF